MSDTQFWAYVSAAGIACFCWFLIGYAVGKVSK